MKPQAFQPGELRDEYDQIIRAGAYGKKTPFVNSDNSAILDYIINNFDALYAQIPNGRAYVKSVNNITPDSNGNVTVNVGTGGGGTGGTNITVDSTLSSTSTNPVQNKVLYAALNNKLDKNGTATYAARDSSGNVFGSTYATKTELSKCVKSINNLTPDGSGNVNISTSGGGTNITVDTTLSSTSTNAIQNKAVYAALSGKLDKTGTAAAATKATQDGAGNVITETYTKKADFDKTIGQLQVAFQEKVDRSDLSDVATSGQYSDLMGKPEYVVQSVNNVRPDENGNVSISVSGGGGVSTSESNTWTGKQTFQKMKFNFESYNAPRISGATDNPSSSVAVYNVQGNFTLDMSTLAGLLSNGDATVLTAYITANGSYTLSITNAGTLKYAGSATDLAITANGLLLNIMLIKSSSGVLSSVAQASTLS